ncbi:MAG TPA: trypsin-like peptidase domain-containing protein [Polyangia bacterium]
MKLATVKPATVQTGLVILLLIFAGASGCRRGAPGSKPGEGAAPGSGANEPPPPSLAPGGTVTPKTEAPNEARVLSSAFSAVARALRPSVVRIDVEIDARVAERGDDDDDDLAPFFRHFFGQGMPEQTPGPQRGTGSGVVMDARGDIVTNRHVVSNASKLKVTLNDGREFTAKTLGTDAETDVAVIRLDKPPADLVAARLGDSDKLDVGEWVLAVGSPLGLDQTVTAGIVSGLGKVGRHVQMSGGRVRHYIQTDAKINPGNSGGPLVNLSSEVVGINTLINTGPGGAYGFAIPINQVRTVAGSLLKEGRVRYAYLGVMVGDIEGLDPSKKAQLPGVEHGVYVSQVTPGGPAAKAGLHAGDVITEIDGRKMDAAGDVIDYVSSRAIGSRVTVGLVRAGKPQKFAVELGELPSTDGRPGAPAQKLGLGLQTLTPELAESMGLERGLRGAVVAEVAPGSAAAAAGVREGDVILEVDRQRIASADEAANALSSPRNGGHLVRIRGAAGIRFITLGGD